MGISGDHSLSCLKINSKNLQKVNLLSAAHYSRFTKSKIAESADMAPHT